MYFKEKQFLNRAKSESKTRELDKIKSKKMHRRAMARKSNKTEKMRLKTAPYRLIEVD